MAPQFFSEKHTFCTGVVARTEEIIDEAKNYFAKNFRPQRPQQHGKPLMNCGVIAEEKCQSLLIVRISHCATTRRQAPMRLWSPINSCVIKLIGKCSCLWEQCVSSFIISRGTLSYICVMDVDSEVSKHPVDPFKVSSLFLCIAL